jgi:hypothetical protein
MLLTVSSILLVHKASVGGDGQSENAEANVAHGHVKEQTIGLFLVTGVLGAKLHNQSRVQDYSEYSYLFKYLTLSSGFERKSDTFTHQKIQSKLRRGTAPTA